MGAIVIALLLTLSTGEPRVGHSRLQCAECHVSLAEVRERAHSPGGLTRLCLSCHDGSAASAVGHGHPVGILVPRGRVDLVAPDDLLAGGQSVECSSCHDPHGRRRYPKLLRTSSADALCFSCHRK